MSWCPSCKAPLRPLYQIAAEFIPDDESNPISIASLRTRVYGDQPRSKDTVYFLVRDIAFEMRRRGRVLKRKKVRVGRSAQTFLWSEPFKLSIRVSETRKI